MKHMAAHVEAWMVSFTIRALLEDKKHELESGKIGSSQLVKSLEDALDEIDAKIEAEHDETYQAIVVDDKE